MVDFANKKANSDFQVDLVVGTTRDGSSIKPGYTQSENYDKKSVNLHGLESDLKRGIGDAAKNIQKGFEQRSPRNEQSIFSDKEEYKNMPAKQESKVHPAGQDKQSDPLSGQLSSEWEESCLNCMATEWYKQHTNIVADIAVGNALMKAKSSTRKYIERSKRIRRTMCWDYEDDDEKQLVEVTAVSALREAVYHIQSLKLRDPYKMRQDNRSIPHQPERQIIGKRSDKKEVSSALEDLVGMAVYMNLG